MQRKKRRRVEKEVGVAVGTKLSDRRSVVVSFFKSGKVLIHFTRPIEKNDLRGGRVAQTAVSRHKSKIKTSIGLSLPAAKVLCCLLVRQLGLGLLEDLVHHVLPREEVQKK